MPGNSQNLRNSLVQQQKTKKMSAEDALRTPLIVLRNSLTTHFHFYTFFHSYSGYDSRPFRNFFPILSCAGSRQKRQLFDRYLMDSGTGNLRVVKSTRNSISLAWDVVTVPDRTFTLQMKKKIVGWITVYRGYKTETEVRDLEPGDCFRFRLKTSIDGLESEWSSIFFAATEDEVIPVNQLFGAVRNGRVVGAKKIISQRPSSVNIPDRLGRSPIGCAIRNGDVSMVTLLANSGADLGLPETGSWRTPLMTAAGTGHPEIVRVLVERGCSWQDRDRNGLTALHYAAENSQTEVVKYALETGAEANEKDDFGWSPLSRAVVLQADLDMLELLLDNGADVNGTDLSLQTPLMLAVLSGRADAVEFLLSRGADPTRRNVYGHSAYDLGLSKEKIMASMLSREDAKENGSRIECGRSRWRPPTEVSETKSGAVEADTCDFKVDDSPHSSDMEKVGANSGEPTTKWF